MRRRRIGAVVLAPLLVVGWVPARASVADPDARSYRDDEVALEASPEGTSSTWPVVHRVETTDPVVFVTIDDGWTRSPAAYDQIRARGWPIANFVLPDPLRADPGYYT